MSYLQELPNACMQALDPNPAMNIDQGLNILRNSSWISGYCVVNVVKEPRNMRWVKALRQAACR